MANLLKKSWFVDSLIIGMLLITFLLNLWAISLNMTIPYENENLFYLAYNLFDGDYLYVFAFVLMLLFYISIVPLLFAGLSIYKRNSWGITSAVIYFLGFNTLLIVFQSIFNQLSVSAIILIIVAILLLVFVFVLNIFRHRAIMITNSLQQDIKETKFNGTKFPLYLLVLDIVSVVIFSLTFFIPIYTILEFDPIYNAVVLNVLFLKETDTKVIVYFLINFIFFLRIFLYLAECLSYYLFDRDKFIDKSKSLIILIFISTILFFIAGLSINMYFTIRYGDISRTLSYIPMLIMLIVVIGYAFLIGKFGAYNQAIFGENKMKFSKIEPLVYIGLLTAVSAFMLLIPVTVIDITSGVNTYTINLTSIDILRDYANLNSDYRTVSFILVIMLISISLSLLITLTSYISRFKQLNAIIKLTATINFLFVFVITLCGYYFQIAKGMTQSTVLDMANLYDINLVDSTNFTYSIGTSIIYILAVSVLIIIIMFSRKGFDRDDHYLLNAGEIDVSSESGGSSFSNNLNDESIEQFDPCYAFTELDSKIEQFNLDLKNRQSFKKKGATLNDLVHFVVKYAKNSRLHLSYTPEDIATFVAGLGASKLSILQGMSGTGKTSLPKIFTEAIFGNCEIVEVESSWKDKNELLGYYNEFSMKYTPKKFTQALYKATLNKEIFTIILLDEMNLSRIEYYFSDFLSLMENEEDKREIKLINIKLTKIEDKIEINYQGLENGNTLRIPENIWFIGTANRDESTFVISDKVYDRAHTINFTKRAPKVRDFSEPIPQQFYDYDTINSLFNDAKSNGSFDAENSPLIKSVEELLAPYNISFGNRILKQIEDFVNIYVECFKNKDVESVAIEKILLSKVVSKLEVKTIDDKEKLEMDFEKLKLYECVNFIKLLDSE